MSYTVGEFGKLHPTPAYGWNVGLLDFLPLSVDGTGALNTAGGGGGSSVDQGTGGLSPWLVTGPLTDAQLRAARVPVELPPGGSGLTDTELRASAVPMSLASVPLATGAATSAKQDTGNTSVASIDTKTPALGQAAMAASQPVVIASNQSAVPVSGPVTDTQLRATPVPVSGTVTVNTGLTDAQLRAAAVPVSLATLPALVAGSAAIGKLAANSGVDIGDVDVTSLPAITGTVTANAGTNLNTSALALDASITTLNTSVNTLLKPANTLAAVTSLTQMNGQAIAMGTGVRSAGTQRVTVATDDVVPVTPPALTKGTQGATGFSTQDLKDAGRNQTNYFHAVPIITTTAEVMQSLTGYKSGAAVAATVTPAVVTAGKVYRINLVVITYWAATVIGGARVNLRANLSGVAVVGSPLVYSWQVGMPAVFTAGAANTYTFPFPDGLEFAAGTGIAIGVIGEGTVPTTGTITGYVMVAIHGYEY